MDEISVQLDNSSEALSVREQDWNLITESCMGLLEDEALQGFAGESIVQCENIIETTYLQLAQENHFLHSEATSYGERINSDEFQDVSIFESFVGNVDITEDDFQEQDSTTHVLRNAFATLYSNDMANIENQHFEDEYETANENVDDGNVHFEDEYETANETVDNGNLPFEDEYSETVNEIDDNTQTGSISNVEEIEAADQTDQTPIDFQNRTTCVSRADLQHLIMKLAGNDEAEKLHGWSQKSIEECRKMFSSKSACSKSFRKFELAICIDVLGRKLVDSHVYEPSKMTKPEIVQVLVNLDFDVGIDRGRRSTAKLKQKKVDTLQSLCSVVLEKQHKHTLAKIIAEHTWAQVVNSWKDKGPIPQNIVTTKEGELIQWFSQPSVDDQQKIRFHFTDACHILTCIRTKLCSTGIQGLNRKAWEIAALSKNTNLNIAVIVDCIDKQDVSLARRVFSKEVQDEMTDNFKCESLFCQLIRNWFDSEDEPSIDASVRCQRRLELRTWLVEGYNDKMFPPPTRYIKGIPIQTFEALVTHLERKIQLYPFCIGQNYNVRAVGSQQVENFFSTFRDMDSTGQGTPKPDSIPEMMAAVSELDTFRMDPNRTFYMATARSNVYPRREFGDVTSSAGDESFLPIADSLQNFKISPQNNFFDTARRRIRKHKRKSGRISAPSESAHGERGVRQYHARDDTKILAHRRQGSLELPELD